MGLDVNKNPFLYSVGTQLAYKVAKWYYHNVHYVWCTTAFHSIKQPPTSDPATICKRYLEQISTGDRHTKEIENNIAGILKGAKAKKDCGVITSAEYNDIRHILAAAEYEAFFPILYIVDSKKVESKCIEVKTVDRASDDAVEYKIMDLVEEEFELLSFKDMLSGVVSIVDKKVGV